MILTDLTLINFRNHRKLHLKLNSGIVGIVGKNGHGKSSIIEAIQFLFTGEGWQSKESMITTGEATGYVSGGFLLNGKAGKLERHLDVSKTILTYDGQTLKKSTEVRELWDKLLQINSEIFKRVIIARQGQVAGLFSGEQAIREQVFQRIFVVPPTEKIRRVIWDSYIKETPPELPVENIEELQRQELEIITNIHELRAQQAALELQSEEEIDRLKNYVSFLQKCKTDKSNQLKFSVELAKCKGVVQGLEQKYEKLKSKLGSIDIELFRQIKATLEQQKGQYDKKVQLEQELNAINISQVDEQLAGVMAKMLALKEPLTKAYKDKALFEFQISECVRKIKQLKQLDDNHECPTCGTQLQDVDTVINHIENERHGLTMKLHEVVRSLRTLEPDQAQLQEDERQLKNKKDLHSRLVEQCRCFNDITFDNNRYERSCKVIEKYDALQLEITQLRLELADEKRREAEISTSLATLAKYDGDTPIEDEIRATALKLANDKNTRVVFNELTMKLDMLNFRLENITKRIQTTETVKIKNEKRKYYLDKLQSIYQVLHTSEFPRKLILSYADVVTEYLDNYLELFNIPFKSRVNENFRIDMVNRDGQRMPKVSGGQEVIVGLSLHLALHDLFSQSFPLMVIDEGTTHLDSDNRKAYFDVIKTLKDTSKLKQMIIIDHDEALSSVVDSVIQL